MAKRGRRLGWRCLAVAAAVCAVPALRARAQDAPIPLADDAASRVHLNDSFEAREALRRIDQLIEQRRWPQAVQRLQELADTEGRRLFQTDDGTYITVGEHVANVIAGLPAPGMRAYRNAFEPTARAAAIGVTDMQQRFALIDRYFATETAGRLADETADRLIEAGRLTSAVRLLTRLLDHHPDFVDRPISTVAKLGIVQAWAGRRGAATSCMKEIESREPYATIAWGRTQQPAVELLKAQLALSGAPELPAGRFSWPMYGGNDGHNRIIESDAEPGADLWSIDLAAVTDPEDETQDGLEDVEPDDAPSMPASMFPAIAGGVIYAQDAQTVWAVEAETGRTLWRAEPGSDENSATAGFSERGGPAVYAPTITEDAVYAVLGEPLSTYYGASNQRNRSNLVRVDRSTGAFDWAFPVTKLGHEFARVQFGPAPIVDGDRVYVVARRHKTSGFEDAFLACIDARTGALRWQTHISSAAIGGYGYRLPTISVAAFADDTVYVNTNLGAVAALDAWTGDVRWLRAYDRLDPSQSEGRLPRNVLPDESWECHPVYIDGERIVVLPTDADRLFAIDAETGVVLQEVPRSSLGDPITLIGARDRRVYALGRELVAYDLSTDQQLWSRPTPDAPLRGRPALSTTAVFWSCAEAIVQWNLATGHERQTAWAQPAQAGNLLLLPDRLLSLSATQMTLMERADRAMARLDRRIDAEPTDPRPRLELAELALRTEAIDHGSAALREALALVDRLAYPELLTDDTFRTRLYNACLAYGTQAREAPTPDHAAAADWFRNAGRHVVTLPQQIEYRLDLATELAASDRPADAIAVYRQLILDRSLNGQALPGAELRNTTAGREASNRIARLIEKHGRGAYDAVERDAAAAVERAKQRGTERDLIEIAELYPNALVAVDAMREAAERARQDGAPLRAARHLDRLLTDFADRVDAPVVILSLARCYRDADHNDAALAWLSAGSRRFPNATVSHDDDASPRAFADIAAEWRAEQTSTTQLLPALQPPLRFAGVTELPPDTELLMPDQTPPALMDRFLGYANRAIHCWYADTGEPAWPEPAECRVQPTFVGVTSDHVIFKTRFQVFALDLDDGHRVWTVGQYPSDIEDARTDPEWFGGYERVVFGAGRLICIRDDGKAMLVNPDTGEKEWETELPGRSNGPAAITADRFAYVDVGGELGTPHVSSILWVHDLPTGDVRHQIDLNHRDSIPDNGLRWLPTGTLLVATTRRLEAFDPETGRRLWSGFAETSHKMETLQITVEGVYIAESDLRVWKRSHVTGRPLWTWTGFETERPAGMDIEIQPIDSDLMVRTSDQIFLLDARDGRLVREDAALQQPQIYDRITPMQTGVAAVVVEQLPLDGDPFRVGLQFIAPPADTAATPTGAPSWLTQFQNARLLLANHAVLLFEGDRVHRWVDATVPPPAETQPDAPR